MSDRDYEAEASEQGWVDKDEWKGDPEKHVEAKIFVERGEKIAGILKSRLDRQEVLIKGLQDSNKQFGEYHKKTLADQQKRNAEKIVVLEGQLAQSITDSDGNAAVNTQREIDSLKSEVTPIDAGAEEWGRLANDWANDNKWYGENPKLRRYADGVSDEIRNEGFTGLAYFSELTKRVQEDFPDDFTNPNRSKPNSVDTGGELSTKDSKEKTYDNLPPDAKKAQATFERDFGLSREDYVKTYEWEE